MKLQSMVSFVLEQEKELNCALSYNAFEFHKRVITYARFLLQQLNLGMFVPCGEDGLPMKKPEENDLDDSFFKMQTDFQKDKAYQQAVDRVLFECCSVIKFPDHWLVLHKEEEPLWVSWNKSKTVESLIDRELTLTATAVNQLNK